MVLYSDRNNPFLNDLKNELFLNTPEGKIVLRFAYDKICEDDKMNKKLEQTFQRPKGVLIGKTSLHLINKSALYKDLGIPDPEIRPAKPPVQEENKPDPKFNISRWALAAGVLGGTSLAGIGGYQYLAPNNNHAANTNNDDDKNKQKPTVDPITQAAQTLSHIATDLEKVMNDIEKIEDKKSEPKKEPKVEKPVPEKPIERKPDTVISKQDCSCRGEWSEWVNNSKSRICVVRDSKDRVISTESQSTDDPFCYKSCSPETNYVNALIRQEKVIAVCKTITRLEPKEWESREVGQGYNNEFWIPEIKLSKKADVK
jgi:hypothetical protein